MLTLDSQLQHLTLQLVLAASHLNTKKSICSRADL